ncbi:MAG: ComEC family competence protein, partial [Armatimonadota bacterium]|nr:ComEC family competence protein [Armatimonadota bacterium]
MDGSSSTATSQSPRRLPPVDWGLALRYRPLLWIAPAIALGCAVGPLFAALTGAATRDSALLFLPSLLALVSGFFMWRWRHVPDRVRVVVFCALVLLCTTHAARRVLPSAHDVSALVRPADVAPGPQKRLPVTLHGWVADHPQAGDFKLRFPLECRQVTGRGVVQPPALERLRGRVWIEAPRAVHVEVGDEVRLDAELADLPRPGNSGERSPQMRFIREGCWCLARVDAATDLRVTESAARYPLERWIAGLRQRLLRHYEAAFAGTHGPAAARPYPHATAQLLSAMVFGEGGLREPLPRLIRDQFRAAGLAHILVASGTQVTFLALLLIFGARTIGLRRWWLMAAVLPVLLLYAFLTGGAASIWRATVGGLCVAWALLLGRDIDGLSLWSFALGLLLCIDPVLLFDLSFQLTFAATWGMIVLGPRLGRLLESRFGSNFITEMACFSVGAQLATTPLFLYQFGRISLAGVYANLVGIPLASVLVGSGILGLFLPISTLSYWLTRSLASIAATATAAPGAQVETPPLNLTWALLCYV